MKFRGPVAPRESVERVTYRVSALEEEALTVPAAAEAAGVPRDCIERAIRRRELLVWEFHGVRLVMVDQFISWLDAKPDGWRDAAIEEVRYTIKPRGRRVVIGAD
jgi:hypothetical protein